MRRAWWALIICALATGCVPQGRLVVERRIEVGITGDGVVSLRLEGSGPFAELVRRAYRDAVREADGAVRGVAFGDFFVMAADFRGRVAEEAGALAKRVRRWLRRSPSLSEALGENFHLIRRTNLVSADFDYTERIPPLGQLYPRVCWACEGRGFVVCPLCGGSGREPCPTCGGRGWVECPTCGGTGEILNPLTLERVVCPTCGGTGRIVCPTCRGRGTVPCPLCGGSGRIPCPFCGGTGRPGPIQRALVAQIERAVDITYALRLPGRVYKTNADEVAGGWLIWRITLHDLERGRTLYASSRAVVWPGVFGLAGMAACLLLGAVLLAWRLRLARKLRAPEEPRKYSLRGR